MACFLLALAPGRGWAGGTEAAAVAAGKVSRRTRAAGAGLSDTSVQEG